MKKIFVIVILMLMSFGIHAQDQKEEKSQSFNRQRLFTGGDLNLGFSSIATNLGISPVFGYSVSNWADAGVTLNFNYLSQRDYQTDGDKLRQTIIGPGVFVRLFPINFLFGTAQYEYNFMRYKYIPAIGPSTSNDIYHINAPSLLLGIGYAGGRVSGSNTYYYFSISWDVMRDQNSPYVDVHGREIPVIRAGYNIGLFQGKRNY
ncbi:MAG: hypothetical protein J0H55_05565 [Chitinophagaceae bacterium]|nr:hypothetical protein [Chitinophagaceae bacterium]